MLLLEVEVLTKFNLVQALHILFVLCFLFFICAVIKKVSVFGWLAVLVICSFCGSDFKSLGRHQWRCKSRTENRSGNTNTTNERRQGGIRSQHGRLFDCVSEEITRSVSNVLGVRCACGKHCKGPRGLKSHQRTCRFIAGLNGEFFEVTDDQQQEELIDTNEFLPPDELVLKPGIKLPKSDS